MLNGYFDGEVFLVVLYDVFLFKVLFVMFLMLLIFFVIIEIMLRMLKVKIVFYIIVGYNFVLNSGDYVDGVGRNEDVFVVS